MKKHLISKKNITKWTIPVVFLLFMVIIISRNIQTYYSIRNNTGYTVGIITEIEFDDGAQYVRYEYTVDGKKMVSKQLGGNAINNKVLVVYDTTDFEFSMVANYPLSVLIDSNNNILQLDTSFVDYNWSHYLPYD